MSSRVLVGLDLDEENVSKETLADVDPGRVNVRD